MSPRKLGLAWVAALVAAFLTAVGVLSGWRGLRELLVGLGFVLGFFLLVVSMLACSHAIQYDRWPWDDDGRD